MRQRISRYRGLTFHPLHLAVDHDDVVVVPVRSRGREDEDEAEEADTSVHEEGGGEAEACLDVPEGLGDDEPAEVGGHIGDGVGDASWPHGKDLSGHDPGKAAQAQVEGNREAHEKRKRKPGVAVNIKQHGSGSS